MAGYMDFSVGGSQGKCHKFYIKTDLTADPGHGENMHYCLTGEICSQKKSTASGSDGSDDSRFGWNRHQSDQ